jgi:hypothetical protein
VYPGARRFLRPRGDPGAIDVARLRTVLRATKDLSAGVAPSYRNKGYPCFKVSTVAPGPTAGEGASLQVGPKSVSCVSPAWLVTGASP